MHNFQHDWTSDAWNMLHENVEDIEISQFMAFLLWCFIGSAANSHGFDVAVMMQ